MGVDTGFTRENHHGPGWADLAEEYLPCTVQRDAVIGRSERVSVFLSGSASSPRGTATEDDPTSTTDPAAPAGLVPTLWRGLSARAELGAGRAELLEVVRLVPVFITPTRPEQGSG